MVTMACPDNRNGLRSGDLQIVKDIGSISSLPHQPLTKRDILARFNAIRGPANYRVKGSDKENNPLNNKQKTEKKVAQILGAEIQERYRKFGLKTLQVKHICAKVLSVKKDYYKSLKSPSARSKFCVTSHVSFRAKNQPREILNKDIEWYEEKLNGGSGSLGPVDLHAHRREIARLKRKVRKMDNDEAHEPTFVASSESPLEDSEDSNEMVSEDDTPPTPGTNIHALLTRTHY